MKYILIILLFVACSAEPEKPTAKVEKPIDSTLIKRRIENEKLQSELLLKIDSMNKYMSFRFQRDSFAILYYQTGKEKYRQMANGLLDSINKYANKHKWKKQLEF